MQNSAPSRGFLYVATGRQFYEEAVRAARQLKVVSPEAAIAIYTDQAVPAEGPFDQVLGREPYVYGFASKIKGLSETPFERTIFMDTDTFVCSPVDDLFDLLDRFPLAVAQDPTREMPWVQEADIPACFAEPNTGVIAYRREKQFTDLLKLWQQINDSDAYQQLYSHDQPAFRRALYECGMPFVTLAPEYNARMIYPIMLAQKVKIIHARCANIHKLPGILNNGSMPRIYSWSIKEILRAVCALPLLRIGRGW